MQEMIEKIIKGFQFTGFEGLSYNFGGKLKTESSLELYGIIVGISIVDQETINLNVIDDERLKEDILISLLNIQKNVFRKLYGDSYSKSYKETRSYRDLISYDKVIIDSMRGFFGLVDNTVINQANARYKVKRAIEIEKDLEQWERETNVVYGNTREYLFPNLYDGYKYEVYNNESFLPNEEYFILDTEIDGDEVRNIVFKDLILEIGTEIKVEVDRDEKVIKYKIKTSSYLDEEEKREKSLIEQQNALNKMAYKSFFDSSSYQMDNSDSILSKLAQLAAGGVAAKALRDEAPSNFYSYYRGELPIEENSNQLSEGLDENIKNKSSEKEVSTYLSDERKKLGKRKLI